jgi:hypothetical protein
VSSSFAIGSGSGATTDALGVADATGAGAVSADATSGGATTTGGGAGAPHAVRSTAVASRQRMGGAA